MSAAIAVLRRVPFQTPRRSWWTFTTDASAAITSPKPDNASGGLPSSRPDSSTNRFSNHTIRRGEPGRELASERGPGQACRRRLSKKLAKLGDDGGPTNDKPEHGDHPQCIRVHLAFPAHDAKDSGQAANLRWWTQSGQQVGCRGTEFRGDRNRRSLVLSRHSLTTGPVAPVNGWGLNPSVTLKSPRLLAHSRTRMVQCGPSRAMHQRRASVRE